MDLFELYALLMIAGASFVGTLAAFAFKEIIKWGMK